MLILTRKPDESLAIGDDIVVTVLSIEGSQAKICIKGPCDIATISEESADKIPVQKTTKKRRPKITLKKKKLTSLFMAA